MSEFSHKIDWTKEHILKCYTKEVSTDQSPLSKEKLEYKDSDNDKESLIDEHKNLEQDGWLIENLRAEIEPWLTSIFQSEHVSLLTGTGLTTAVTNIAGTENRGMSVIEFEHDDFTQKIADYADKLAKQSQRGDANIEDIFNAAFRLIEGYEILGEAEKKKLLVKELNEHLTKFVKDISETEKTFFQQPHNKEEDKALQGVDALRKLQSFLISFSARSASRERLNIFTTNYDRFIEFGLDTAGILSIDRFVGKIRPRLRTTKLDLDYHYNPPGIRGEPRYVEGVIRMTKLHGSVDWQFEGQDIIKVNMPFGEVIPNNYFEDEKEQEVTNVARDRIVIYPNSAKGIDTILFPYSELFRDLSAAVCRPNSVIVTYGYGFGDSHINRIIEDMLSLPSTHLVIICYNSKDDAGKFDPSRERIKKFCRGINTDQITLMLGSHFGDLSNLVDYYLPKAAIDRIQSKALKIKEDRYQYNIELTGKDTSHE